MVVVVHFKCTCGFFDFDLLVEKLLLKEFCLLLLSDRGCSGSNSSFTSSLKSCEGDLGGEAKILWFGMITDTILNIYNTNKTCVRGRTCPWGGIERPLLLL